MKNIGLALGCSGLVFLLDRITKSMVLYYYPVDYIVNSFISFDLIFNRGFSWSFMHSESTMIFALVSFLVTLITIIFALYTYIQYKNNKVILAQLLIIAGSASNLYDRFVYGGVVDFIVVSYKNYAWPTFNVADMAILLGVFVMIWQEYE